MFLLGVIVGAGIAIGVLWLLRFDGGRSLTNEFSVRRARQQIHDIEQATIHRMLDEAQAARRNRGSSVEILEPEDEP